jgi:hypothetical protein
MLRSCAAFDVLAASLQLQTSQCRSLVSAVGTMLSDTVSSLVVSDSLGFSKAAAVGFSEVGDGAEAARSAVLDWPSTIARYLSAAEEGVFDEACRLPLSSDCSVDATKRTRFRLKPAPKYL